MPVHRRPSVLVTLLALVAAGVLLQAAAPAASAAGGQDRTGRPGRAITLDTNLLRPSGATAWAIDEYLARTTPLPALGAAFMAAERRYGINARFLLAAALHESGWGTSDIARYKHNLFGYNAYDRDPFRYASAFRSFAAGIDRTARFMKEAYLTPGGRWWCGRPTLRCMQRYWSSSGQWGVSVSRVARSVRLPSLSDRSIRFDLPEVRDGLHAGDRATVRLTWDGGAIPTSLPVAATWVPVILDADLLAGPPQDPEADRSTTVEATRTRSGAHAITLAVPGPPGPGSYRLRLSLLDAGGRPLPRADHAAIQAVDVRVWADRAASVELEPSPDGEGVAVRITNTGREPIPAVRIHRRADATAESEGTVTAGTDDILRSVVTVTAEGADPEEDDPVTLLAEPLAADLAPGDSVLFDIPGIEAATGRTADWLAIDLAVLGDPAWLAAYVPAGAWRSASGIGRPAHAAVARPADRAQVRTVAAGAALPVDRPPATPEPAPPTPEPAPATPAPATPAPAPASTSAPVPAAKPATTTTSERSRAIDYRGRWGNAQAPGYEGGNAKWSTTPGATATFTFRGSSVAWIGPLGPTRGSAQVLVDGRHAGTVNLWRRGFTARAVVFRHTFPSAGRHTLTIRVLASPGHPYVSIDAFAVRP